MKAEERTATESQGKSIAGSGKSQYKPSFEGGSLSIQGAKGRPVWGHQKERRMRAT